MSVVAIPFDPLRRIVETIVPRAFLVGVDRRGDLPVRATVHVADTGVSWLDRLRLFRAARESGTEISLRIRKHRRAELENARSLQQLMDPLCHDAIASDPTGCFERGMNLVAFAQEIRKASSKRVTGIYWSAIERKLFVVYDRRDFVARGKIRVAELAACERTVMNTLRDKCGAAQRYIPHVRLGFGLPDTPVVPVDQASYFTRKRPSSWLRGKGIARLAAALFGAGVAGAAATASAADLAEDSLCAVSAPNGKIAVEGGWVDEDDISSEATGLIDGSFSLPLGCEFGFQADGVAGFRDGEFIGGVGGHLFWRDPDVGLLGIMGSHSVVNRDAPFQDQDITIIGGEGELYLDQFTIAAAAGYSFGDHIDEGLYGTVHLEWYASDNLVVDVGGTFSEERDVIGQFGFEFQPGFDSLPGLSLFAEGSVGSDDWAQATVGLRFYFGESRTLKERHRYDDPPDPLNHAKNALKIPVAEDLPSSS